MTHSIISLGQRAALSALLLRASRPEWTARPAFSVGHFDPLIPLRVKSSAGWRHLIFSKPWSVTGGIRLSSWYAPYNRDTEIGSISKWPPTKIRALWLGGKWTFCPFTTSKWWVTVFVTHHRTIALQKSGKYRKAALTRFHRGLTKCQVEVSCNTDRVNVLSLNTLN